MPKGQSHRIGIASKLDADDLGRDERIAFALLKLRSALKTAANHWARRIQNEVNGYELKLVAMEGDFIIVKLGDLRFRITVEGQ